jgi:VanZ family protein
MRLIKNLLGHKRIIQVLTVFWTGLVAYLCLVRAESLPNVNVFRYDKIGHFSFHFGITLLWFLFWKTTYRNENKYALVKAFLFSFFFGVAIELGQGYFTTTRHSDIHDIYANSVGSLTAVFTIFMINKMRSKNL